MVKPFTDIGVQTVGSPILGSDEIWGRQALAAVDFFTSGEGKKQDNSGVSVVGHSLGGGLAGFNSHLYNIDAFIR